MTREELIDFAARLGTERDALRTEVAALRKVAVDALTGVSRCGQCSECVKVADEAIAALSITEEPGAKTQFTDGHGNSLDHLLDEKP